MKDGDVIKTSYLALEGIRPYIGNGFVNYKDVEIWKKSGRVDITDSMGSTWKKMLRCHGTTATKDDWFRNWIKQFVGQGDKPAAPFASEFLNKLFRRFKGDHHTDGLALCLDYFDWTDWATFLKKQLKSKGWYSWEIWMEISDTEKAIKAFREKFNEIKASGDINSFLQLHEDIFKRFSRYSNLKDEWNVGPFDEALEILFGYFLPRYTEISCGCWSFLKKVIFIKPA